MSRTIFGCRNELSHPRRLHALKRDQYIRSPLLHIKTTIALRFYMNSDAGRRQASTSYGAYLLIANRRSRLSVTPPTQLIYVGLGRLKLRSIAGALR